MSVLIVSSPLDVHAQAVSRALAARGAAFELLDLADFPVRLRLSMHYAGAGRNFELRHGDGRAIDLSAVQSVWWRRPQPFTLPDAIVDPDARAFAMSEANTAFHGLYQSLDACWINPPARDFVAGHKPYQLTVAQQLGLEIPPTLITSDPDAARAFWRAHPGEVIQKQFVAMPATWRETRRIGAADEMHAQSIAHAPVIFQRHVAAVADLRVIAVGKQLFAAETRLDDLPYPQDVRMNAAARYVPHRLPETVASRLSALMKRLGLVYGAIDLRLTADGRYVFLEINPAGQFLYIELDTGQPITEAVAGCLLGARRGMEVAVTG